MHVYGGGIWSWPQESIKMTVSSESQCHVLALAGRQGDDLSALGPGVVGLGRQSWALVITAASHKLRSSFWFS